MDDADPQELRGRVARRVMGWHSQDIAWAYDGTACLWHDESGTPILTVHTWQPDDDDGQCMQVLERMLQCGFRLYLECDHAHCQARFERDGTAGRTVHDTDRRRALLRAALAAMDDIAPERHRG